jgi:sulfotransferase
MTKINTFKNRKKQLISDMLESYYSDVDKPIIIDREKSWGHPANVEMLKDYLDVKPKIIYTIRPIAEVLASYIAIAPESIIENMQKVSWKNNPKLSLTENMCEFLMNPESYISANLLTIKSIKHLDNDGIFYTIKYHDLLNSPQKTMDNIYQFLGIGTFKHNFKNIRKIEEYGDTAAGLPKDLHKIRRQLSKSDVRVNEYVSEYIQNKYSYIDDLFK